MSAALSSQQVNLYQPLMGAEKRLFSARAIGVALTVLAVSLLGIAFYGSTRTRHIEASVREVEAQEVANVDLAGRASLAVRPTQSLAELDAEAKALTAAIDSRTRVLAIVQGNGADPATGFAARLEALARRHVDGVWLTAILLGMGDNRLAMRGGTTDSRLLPGYLAALGHDDALAGVRFEKLEIRRGLPAEAPAQVVFELDGPGLPMAARQAAAAQAGAMQPAATQLAAAQPAAAQAAPALGAKP
jgi:hypothetical protein